MDGITTSINEILKDLIKNFNTLLDCPVRFSGEYNEQKVHSFIEYIEYYKQVKCITDEQALQELQYLLQDQAHDWWLRRKKNLSTWSEALTILENQFSKKRPANVIYTQILKHHYEDYECKDDFIDDKIELLNELSQPELKESNKLEIIYALLPNNIKNKVKLVNISGIKELKGQLKLIKLDSPHIPSNKANITSNSKGTSGVNVVLTEVENTGSSTKDSNCQQKNINITVVSISSEMENNADSERDPIIKVRRTEDLMPQDIKEEEESQMHQEEFLDNDTESSVTNNIFHKTNHFQIDADIMNQINNIIDESENNTSRINSNHQDTPTILSQPANGVSFLGLLGLEKQPTIQSKKSPDHESKSTATKKVRKRCPYCRIQNRTSHACVQRVKQMKYTTKTNEKITNDESTETSPLNISSNNNNNNIVNTQPTETSLTAPMFLNQLPTTSTFADTIPAVASSNASEKSTNPMLTTKLIAPINGKTSNKMLAAKLRSINTPSPKCHQCGTLGFYKSICPNCSPIYNNNSHNHYSK